MEESVLYDEHDLYPVHEEDSVPQNPAHFDQILYLASALRTYCPDLWTVSDVCLYWERASYNRYVAPDITVVECPPPAEPVPVHLRWSDPPLLFVAEIGSRSSLVADTGPKVEVFERFLRVPEYLYADPPRGDLRLWRMADDRYQMIPRDPNGRVTSLQLNLSFGYDAEGDLRAYTLSGQRFLGPEEQAARADAEAARADAEAARADAESRARGDAERRVAELMEELQRLRGSGAGIGDDR